ncbi:MAG: hypothetical protein IKW85_13410 [Muribaculaceae bacterium]|nr:hypothetical protein [Muribaculaceae bacterium]
MEVPQEKIHVMTSQGSYLAGDTIWPRAWVVDAATHQPVNASEAHNTTHIVTIEGVGNDGTLFRTTHQVTKR